MTGYHIAVSTQNERAATEVTTPPVGQQRASAASLTESTARSLTLEARVCAFLYDLQQSRPSATHPTRRRDEDEELCRRGCGRPAFRNCECATCGREEVPSC